jgi:hypothetical protein
MTTKEAKMCSCGHVHAAGVKCNRLVSGVSAGGGGAVYCACTEWHDPAAPGALPGPPPIDEPL